MAANDTLKSSPYRADLPQSAATVRWPVLAACALGALIVFGVGFAGPEVIHNAAHDSRHSLNFPCH